MAIGDLEPSTRRRILDATHVVFARSGHRNLQLSDVAAEAKVSRPTLYRYFGSREGLLNAFALYEQDNFDAGIAKAMAGLDGPARLDAALRFVVDFQDSYSLGSIVDIEPEHVLSQMKRVLPIMHERIARVIPGSNSDIAAAAVVRIAVCHYLVQAGSPEDFLAELRLAAGLDPRQANIRRNGRTGGFARDGLTRSSVS
ncbi:MAG: helix-turn-helix domain-containing protein [Mycobacterium sp.]